MYIFVSGAEAHRMTSKVAADRTRKERKLVTVGSVEIMAGYTCVYVKAHFSHISNAYGTGERSKASQKRMCADVFVLLMSLVLYTNLIMTYGYTR